MKAIFARLAAAAVILSLAAPAAHAQAEATPAGTVQEASDSTGQAVDSAADAATEAAEPPADATAQADEPATAPAAAPAAVGATAAVAAGTVAEEPIDTYYRGRWVGMLAISGSLNINSTSQMPGQPNGLSLTFNTALDGVADYYRGSHEWRNTFAWNVGVTRSAAEGLWVKSIDRLLLQSGYYYRVNEWFGAFAELQLRSSVLPLYIQRPDAVDFCSAPGGAGDCNDGAANFVESTNSFRATGGFQPITLDERIGVYVRPLDRRYVTMSVRTGLGAQQFFVSDNAWAEVSRDTNAVIVRELSNYNILGLLADARLRGANKEETFVYGTDLGILFPFVDSKRQELRDLDISPLQVDLSAFITFTLASWASLDIRGTAFRQPQVTGSDWQRSLNVLLTFSHILVGDRDASREAGTTLRYEDFVGADGAP